METVTTQREAVDKAKGFISVTDRLARLLAAIACKKAGISIQAGSIPPDATV